MTFEGFGGNCYKLVIRVTSLLIFLPPQIFDLSILGSCTTAALCDFVRTFSRFVIYETACIVWTTYYNNNARISFNLLGCVLCPTMASYLYCTVLIYVCFSCCPWSVFTRDYEKLTKSKVLLTNDGPTTFGGQTTFSAVVLGCSGTQYRYCWRSYDQQNCYDINEPKYKLVMGNWSTTGKKEMTVIVERMSMPYKNCGECTTSLLVTDTINAQLTAFPQPKKYYYSVGPVNISVKVHDPSHLFDPKKINYHWNFNDSTEPVTNHLHRMTHNFTEDRVYAVSVFITSHAIGKLYNGTASKTLPFAVDFSPALLAYNLHDGIPSPMLRLAPPSKSILFVALGAVQFIITYNNPYSIIKNITTGWSFQKGGTFPHFPGSRKTYNYTSVEESTYVWATPRFVTSNMKKSIIIQQAITVEEPVSDLNLMINSSCTTKKDLQVNVTCRGSKPFKMCWKLFKTVDDPLFDNCSSLYQTCGFQINYTIPYSGSFTLDVSILNYVSSVNHIEHFKIPEPSPKPHHGTAAKTARAVVPIIICVIIVVIVLVFVARKVYRSRHHSVLETADFDFRDEDSRSLDSYLIDNLCCYSFRFCRRFSRKKENIPLLEDWGRTNSNATSYSDIL